MNGLENLKVGDEAVCLGAGMLNGMVESWLKVAKVTKTILFLTKNGQESDSSHRVKISSGKSVSAGKWDTSHWYATTEPRAIEAIEKTRKANALYRMKKQVEQAMKDVDSVESLRGKLLAIAELSFNERV